MSSATPSSQCDDAYVCDHDHMGPAAIGRDTRGCLALPLLEVALPMSTYHPPSLPVLPATTRPVHQILAPKIDDASIAIDPPGSQIGAPDIKSENVLTWPVTWSVAWSVRSPVITWPVTVDDPYSWSISRVIEEFCYKLPLHTRPPLHTLPEAQRPDLTKLEQAFRLYEVTGSVLLHDISHRTLEERYMLPTLGKRAYVRFAVKKLWLLSQQFQSEAKSPKDWIDHLYRCGSGLQLRFKDKRLDELARKVEDSSRDRKRKRSLSNDDGPENHEHKRQQESAYWWPELRSTASEEFALSSSGPAKSDRAGQTARSRESSSDKQ